MTTYALIPDFRATATIEASQGDGIIADILKMYPEVLVLPVLNGLPLHEMTTIAKERATDRLCPIIGRYSERKLVGALMTGYGYLLEVANSSDVVVRLDTAEHDINYIGKLAEAAAEHGAVVGDLDFTNGHLVEGTYDQFIHTDVFPNLYGAMTDGKLRLSCAHGFQGYRVGVLRQILPVATLLVEQVEKNLATTLTWGMDGIMAVTAVSAFGRIHRMPIPAESDRNRATDKINAQLGQHCAILKAAAQMQMI